MGFKKGAWMSVFGVYPNERSNKIIQIAGATSVKSRATGEYETDFSGFCSCIGEAAVNKIKSLNVQKGKPARIRLQEVEVKHTFEGTGQDRKVKYINYNIYDFDFGDDAKTNGSAQITKEDELSVAYEGISDDLNEEGLPF